MFGLGSYSDFQETSNKLALLGRATYLKTALQGAMQGSHRGYVMRVVRDEASAFGIRAFWILEFRVWGAGSWAWFWVEGLGFRVRV